MSITVAHDATHENIGHLPKGQAAGYTTGSRSIQWTAADWKSHPGAVRICQDTGASDTSADVLDVERGAATFADCAPWAKKALENYAKASRPGQRRPAIYFSASNVHLVANALVNGGVKSGVGFYVASWGVGEQNAMSELAHAGGPFPIVGVQYMNGSFFDYDVFSQSWLDDVSRKEPALIKHTVKEGDTIATLAQSRGMTPWDWLKLQHELGANVAELCASQIAVGLTWLSKNP